MKPSCGLAKKIPVVPPMPSMGAGATARQAAPPSLVV
jgi:hypothetical protein